MCVRADSKRWSLVLASAAGSKLNLSLSGATALAALALGTWQVLCLALLIYVAYIGGMMLSPAAWRRAARAQLDAARRLPEPLAVQDSALRNAVAALQSSRRQVEQILAGESKERRDRYRPVLSWMDALEAAAAGLIRQADRIGAYLHEEDVKALEAEMRRLSACAERSADAEAVGEYVRARAAIAQQRAALLEVSRARERLGAQLVRLVAAAQSVPAKLMMVRVLEDARSGALCDEPPGELDWLDGEILGGEELATSVEGWWLRLDGTEAALPARGADQPAETPGTT